MTLKVLLILLFVVDSFVIITSVSMRGNPCHVGQKVFKDLFIHDTIKRKKSKTSAISSVLVGRTRQNSGGVHCPHPWPGTVGLAFMPLAYDLTGP